MRRLLTLFISLIIFSKISFAVVTVDGNVYLENQSDHTGIEILFERTAPSSLTGTTTTNSEGYFTIELETGIYNITYSKNGYFDEGYIEYQFFSNTTLPDTTIREWTTMLYVPSFVCPTIQSAINLSNNGDTVLVQPNNYKENIKFNGKKITVSSLFLTTGDTSYILQTIINGNKNGHVVEFSDNEDTSAILIGFTITNGYAVSTGSGVGSERLGGGIYCSNSSPTIANVIIGGDIGGNTADSYGGRIYLGYSDAILKNVTISSNHGYSGGGLYCNYSNPIITNVTISGNSANYGGGIYCHSSSPTIKNVTIRWNNAGDGGGIYCNSYSNPTITNGIINGNRATNNSTSSGGGIYCNSYSNPTITNIAIISNKTRSMGGGIYCDNNSSPTIVNSIISDNINPYGGSCYGIYVNSGDPSISYSCFWKNGTGNFYNCNEWIGNNVTINSNGDSCDVYNNIQLSPSFFDLENGDFHLSDYSRCIGAGTSDGTMETDIEGNPRPNPSGSNPDLGAFESSLSTPKDMEIYNFDIGGNDDILHLITHIPEITFNCGGPPQTHYQIQVSTQGNYSVIDVWDTGEVESNANNVYYTGNTLEDGVTYYLRGRYASGEVWSSWSLLSFRMNSVPSLPIQLTPLNGISVSSPVILSIINSTDAEGDSLFYSFRIYSDSEFTCIVDSIINHNETPDTTSWSTYNLNENQFYWWNVEAYDGYEKSGFTDTDYFFSNSYNDIPAVEYMILDQSTHEDTLFTFSFGDSVFSDIDAGDSLRFSVTLIDDSALPAWLSFEATLPRTFSGTPSNDDVGSITVKVTATDDSSATIFTEFNIEIINTNDAPIIVTTEIDNAVEDQGYNFTIEATDPDLVYGDHILYSLSVYPEGMTINSTTGEVSWLPDNEDVGDTTLTVSVTDDSSATNEKNFILTVNNTNDAPTVAYLIPDKSTYEDALFTFTFGDTVFYDVDVGDSLRYSAGLSDGTSLPNWLSFEASTPRTFTGIPLNENVGTITIKITAEDDSSATASTEFSMEVINTNDAPVLNPIADQEMLEDSTLTVIVTAIDDDYMDQLELSVESDTSAVAAYFTDKGTELTRELILIPEGNWNGVAIITINVVDQVSKASDTDSFSLTVLPVNDSPELSNIPDQSFTINDTIQIFLNQFIFDPDLPNDNISWSYNGGDSLVIILNAGVAKITNKPEWVGIDSILFIATDDSSESDSDWVYINVIAIPSPYNLAAISGLGCVPLTWQPPDYVMTEELIYDDGSPKWLLTYYDGYRWATRMSPSWPCKILELKYYHGVSGEFLPGIYEWNGTSPGEALLEFAYTSDSIDTGWVSVDISNYNIIVDGDFVVSHGFLNSEVEFGYESGDNGRSWTNSGYGWNLWNHYIHFIRAVVKELSSGKNVELGYGINNSTIPGSVETDIIGAIKNILNHYNIYRSESSGKPYTLIASNVTDTSYIDCDVELSSTYFYTVTSVFSDPPGESGFSNEAFATTNFPPILGEIPDTSFHEDTILELPISFWYDYVEDGDNEDSELIWTFFGGDSVIVNASTDKVNFSSPLNWYGVDTIEIAVSDGEYSDTSSFALAVYPVNDSPVITGIPGQSFAMNDTVQVFLNQYVSDPDLPNDNISWTCYTGENLLITLVDSIARITNVFGWIGTDSVLFIAKDDSMSCDSSWVNFTVVPIYSPRNLSAKSGLTYVPLIWNKPGPQIEELIYDDGSPSGISCGGVNGYKTACRLTSLWPCKVIALKFYHSISSSPVTFLPGIHSWNGTSPDEVILEFSHTVDISGWSWTYADVSEYDIRVSGDFVVSCGYIGDGPDPCVGLDSEDNGRGWGLHPTGGSGWLPRSSTFFIRAIVEKIPGSKDSDTKEIMELQDFGLSNYSFGEDVSYYNIYRSNVSGNSFELIESGIEDTTYIDVNIELGTTYYYVVTAVYSEPTVESEYSDEATATTAFTPVLSSVPDTSFFEDDTLYFPIANLHDYVQDEDTPEDSLLWIVSQNQNVYFNFENDSVLITAESEWFGKDTVLLIVSDGVLSDSTNWIITVRPVNDPPYFTELMPDSISFDSNVCDTLLLAGLASDVDNPDSSLIWSYIQSSFVLCDINGTLNRAIFWVEENLSGQDTIVLSVYDGEFTVYDSLVVIVNPVTGIEYLMSQIPKEYSLKQNYPNPFNPTTTIIYGLPKSSHVDIRIYDLLGREVTTLVNDNQEAKHYKVIWDAKDRSGNTVPSGMYHYRIVARSGDRTFVKTRKLLLMR